MESSKSKCLICEESCPQKGLAFFKFPKNEARLKTSMKKIYPVQDTLKINPASLKENEQICARHFKENDFKKNSLMQNACPNLNVPLPNKKLLEERNLNIDQINEDASYLNGDLMFNSQDKDTFQCGRCKTQFQQLSEFVNHKRSQCSDMVEFQITQNESNEPSLDNSVLSLDNTFLISFDTNVTSASIESNNDENLRKFVNENSSQVENEVVSYVINQNGLLTGNQISPISPRQLFVTPRISENSSVLLSNTSDCSIGNVILTTTTGDSEGELVFTCPLQSNLTTGSLMLTQEVTTHGENVNHIIVTEPEESKVLNNFLLNDSGNLYKLNGSIEEGQCQNLLSFFCDPPADEEKADDSSNDCEKREPFNSPRTKLACSYCGKSFSKPFNLQQHERVHTGERPFQCIVCGRAFSQKSNVRKHMMRHKVWPQAKQTLKMNPDQSQQSISQEFLDQMNYSCQYCSLSFKSYFLYKKHLTDHSNFKVYRCIQKGCDETFSDLDEFLSHSKIHASAEFQCHICLKSFTSLEELGAHQYDHDTSGRDKREIEVKLKCEVCHAQFKTAESLKNHLAVDNHNYECVHCKNVFSSERFLRRHLATHLDPSQSKYKCTNCKKTFRTQKYLQNHMFVHMNEKPFNCEHCDKQFASKYRLKRHLAIHLNQYFECPFKAYLGCHKTFYRKDKLRDHMTTHSNCRIRSCQFCTRTFSSLAKLNQHMRKEHGKTGKGRQVLKCATCSQTFRKQKQLTQHHCTVGERKFRSNTRSRLSEREKSLENVSNIEIFMVPYVTDSGAG